MFLVIEIGKIENIKRKVLMFSGVKFTSGNVFQQHRMFLVN